MIEGLSFKNISVFTNEIYLNLESANTRIRKCEIPTISTKLVKSGELLKKCFIYGANGSGKSTIVKAIEILKRIVFDGLRDGMYNPNRANKDSPSEIAMFFVAENRRYEYSISFSNEIHKEELRVCNNHTVRTKLVFSRENNKIKLGRCLKSLNGAKRSVSWIDSRTSFLFYLLSSSVSIDGIGTQEIRDCFDYKIITNSGKTRLGKKMYPTKFVKQALKFADMDVHFFLFQSSFGLCSITMDDGTPEDLPVCVDTDYEPESAQTFLDLSHALVNARKNGKTLIVDDFGKGLHPRLCAELVDWFDSATGGEENNTSQLIATTHDPSLMGYRQLLRKDEIYFLDTQNTGEVETISLVEYTDLKKVSTFQLPRMYLTGRFSGVGYYGFDLECKTND